MMDDKENGLSAGEFQVFALKQERRLTAYFLIRGVKPEDVRDLCQEALLTFWAKHDKVISDKEANFLSGIARHILLVHWRHSKRRDHEVSLADLPEIGHFEPCPGEGGGESPGDSSTDGHAKVRRLLSHLSPRQAQVIESTYLNGHSHDETARRLNITRGGLKSMKSKAIARLRRLLESSELEE